MENIKNKVKKILLENFKFDDDTDELDIRMKLSSLEYINFIMILEKEYNINITLDEIFNINNITIKVFKLINK